MKSPLRVATIDDATELIVNQRKLGLDNGVLLAVPIPTQHSMDPGVTEDAIQAALIEAKAKKISGKNVTPFLLQKVNELSSGNSLEASKIMFYKINKRTMRTCNFKSIKILKAHFRFR